MIRGVYPAFSRATDPFRDDLARTRGGVAEDLARIPWGHGLSPEQITSLTARFLDLIDEVELGDRSPDDPELAAHLEALHLDGRVHLEKVHDPSGPIGPWADWVRIATDWEPTLGVDAPEAFLGPFADELDAYVPHHRRLLEACVAASVFAELAGEGRTAFELWTTARPNVPLDERDRLRPVERAPWGAFRVSDLSDQGLATAVLTDLLGLAPRFIPKGRVGLDGIIGLWPLRDGDLVFARVVYDAERWWAPVGFSVPWDIPAETLRGWMALEGASFRLGWRRASQEDLLRRRGHVLIRKAHEWGWAEVASAEIESSRDPGASP